ncbi:hypothetical protein TOPH_09146 [Tolypocladium ophioglossoides CBS 100239]|uniref:Endonuclease/exonuclease/phosphatase domain-containing protein n=1 Tax=Tolypocladium ophioglossoides (strain CBS 100239) TaxID=1163406 RepID=A0A0L0MWR6_TOLOC|nr:hypothetical protein TOPH_09146 [Tolypocladium ophioglossoides CBS 100239]
MHTRVLSSYSDTNCGCSESWSPGREKAVAFLRPVLQRRKQRPATITGKHLLAMALLSRLGTQIVSWWQDTPLPNEPDTTSLFQAWHMFDGSSKRWSPVGGRLTSNDDPNEEHHGEDLDRKLVLVTWNVDATSSSPEKRISGIISNILSLTPVADVVFLQEVSRAALSFILDDPSVRQRWYSSEADAVGWEGQSFACMTLLSKARFGHPRESAPRATLGPVWRVKYPSRFGRDALCCDVLFPSSGSGRARTRVRLINVHLDSLPIQPSRRPRQISAITSLIRSAGRGLVAGDFNPVLSEDETLVQDNGLVDAWVELRPQDPGYTWGIDGKQPFPPNRLDKIATLGLQVEAIEVMHPDIIPTSESTWAERNPGQHPERDGDVSVPWSDHSGLKCSFEIPT